MTIGTMAKIKKSPARKPARYTYIGATVRQLREEAGLSQEKLAALIGADRGYITGIEGGAQDTISVTRAKALATVLTERLGRVVPVDIFAEPTGLPRDAEVILMELQDSLRRSPIVRVPILGSIPRTVPQPPLAQATRYMPIPREELSRVIAKVETVYAVPWIGAPNTVENIHEGHYLVIEPDADVLTGDLYYVRRPDGVEDVARAQDDNSGLQFIGKVILILPPPIDPNKMSIL